MPEHDYVEIPWSCRFYIGKKNINRVKDYIKESLCKLHTGYMNVTTIENSNFVVHFGQTKFVYQPCKIYYQLLAGQREKGVVILTLV